VNFIFDLFTWGLGAKLDLILSNQGIIMSTQAELAAQLNTVTAEVTKIGTETQTLLTKIADLTAAIEAGGATTPEVDAALAALQAQVKVVDDLVPDAPPAPAP